MGPNNCAFCFSRIRILVAKETYIYNVYSFQKCLSSSLHFIVSSQTVQIAEFDWLPEQLFKKNVLKWFPRIIKGMKHVYDLSLNIKVYFRTRKGANEKDSHINTHHS